MIVELLYRGRELQTQFILCARHHQRIGAGSFADRNPDPSQIRDACCSAGMSVQVLSLKYYDYFCGMTLQIPER